MIPGRDAPRNPRLAEPWPRHGHACRSFQLLEMCKTAPHPRPTPGRVRQRRRPPRQSTIVRVRSRRRFRKLANSPPRRFRERVPRESSTSVRARLLPGHVWMAHKSRLDASDRIRRFRRLPRGRREWLRTTSTNPTGTFFVGRRMRCFAPRRFGAPVCAVRLARRPGFRNTLGDDHGELSAVIFAKSTEAAGGSWVEPGA